MIERGEANLSPEADRSSRVTVGHAEGMPLAFGNIYTELAQAIEMDKQGQTPDLGLIPMVDAGADSIKAIAAVARSGNNQGSWETL